MPRLLGRRQRKRGLDRLLAGLPDHRVDDVVVEIDRLIHEDDWNADCEDVDYQSPHPGISDDRDGQCEGEILDDVAGLAETREHCSLRVDPTTKLLVIEQP